MTVQRVRQRGRTSTRKTHIRVMQDDLDDVGCWVAR